MRDTSNIEAQFRAIRNTQLALARDCKRLADTQLNTFCDFETLKQLHVKHARSFNHKLLHLRK